MHNISRILLAVEFTPACERARDHALALAARTNAELHVLHVQILHGAEPGWSGVSNIERIEEEVTQANLHHLENFTAPLGRPVVTANERGTSAAPTILRYAAEHEIDLIVVGTHGRRGFSRLFLGSVAAEVIRNAEIPVLVVGPEHDAPPDSYGAILAPVDFSKAAIGALRQAAAAARLHDARLLVLHAVDSQQLPPYFDKTFANAEIERAREMLEELVEEADLGIPVESWVSLGSPPERIITAAEDHEVDLIVMGSTGLSGIGRFLVGSTTDRVLRRAPCALLAFRGEDSREI